GLPEPPHAAVPLELGRTGTHLHLSPGQRRVEFAFTALTFTKPESIGFRYRLHPMDGDWVEAGTLRTATYAQIPPGHYQFEVSACTSEGVWNTTAAALDLTTEPYWWETAWFRVLAPLAAAGILGGGILLGVRRRHRRQIERLELQQATDRERTRIAADLHDDLGARLTELSLLGSLGVRPAIPLAQAQDYLGEVAAKSREMVAALDEIVWAVNPMNDLMPSITSYLCHYAQRFFESTPVFCRLDVTTGLADLTLNSEQRHGLLLALKEALNNVARHSAATEIWLRIFVCRGMLHIVVDDNGQGLPGTAPTAGANGLENMRLRLAGMGGTCHVRSAPGQGTRVEFSLPLAGLNP
ncbi:MAG: histidine kinase, partial [Akkermansiaceae bacterium]|nr:histidine kinase [Akkermansiaceae bacterium]